MSETRRSVPHPAGMPPTEMGRHGGDAFGAGQSQPEITGVQVRPDSPMHRRDAAPPIALNRPTRRPRQRRPETLVPTPRPAMEELQHDEVPSPRTSDFITDSLDTPLTSATQVRHRPAERSSFYRDFRARPTFRVDGENIPYAYISHASDRSASPVKVAYAHGLGETIDTSREILWSVSHPEDEQGPARDIVAVDLSNRHVRPDPDALARGTRPAVAKKVRIMRGLAQGVLRNEAGDFAGRSMGGAVVIETFLADPTIGRNMVLIDSAGITDERGRVGLIKGAIEDAVATMRRVRPSDARDLASGAVDLAKFVGTPGRALSAFQLAEDLRRTARRPELEELIKTHGIAFIEGERDGIFPQNGMGQADERVGIRYLVPRRGHFSIAIPSQNRPHLLALSDALRTMEVHSQNSQLPQVS